MHDIYSRVSSSLKSLLERLVTFCKCQFIMSLRLQLEMLCFNQLVLKLKVLNQNFSGFLRIVSLGTYFIGRQLPKSCVDFNKRVWGTMGQLVHFFQKAGCSCVFQVQHKILLLELGYLFYFERYKCLWVLNNQRFNQYEKVN